MNYKYSYIVGPDTLPALKDFLNKIKDELRICILHGGATHGSQVIISNPNENSVKVQSIDKSHYARKQFGIHTQFAGNAGDNARISCMLEDVGFTGTFNNRTHEFTVLKLHVNKELNFKNVSNDLEAITA